jgi:hypothetical protein
VIDVDNEKYVRQGLHFLNAAETAIELLLLATKTENLFFRKTLETALLSHFLQRHEALHRLANRFVVGEHAAKPAIADKRHFGSVCVCAHGLTRSTLGADEENLAAVSDSRLDERAGFARQREALLEIDDVDLVTIAKDVGCHLRVPVTGLVTKMHASL